MKIVKPALVQTPSVLKYPNGSFRYTAEHMQKNMKKLIGKPVWLNQHKEVKKGIIPKTVGTVVGVSYKDEGLVAEIAAEKEYLSSDQVQFSTDLQVQKTKNVQGIHELIDWDYNGIVLITDPEVSARNPNTRLCNVGSDGKIPDGIEESEGMDGVNMGLEKRIEELNAELGMERTKKETAESKVQQLEQENANLKKDMKDMKDKEKELEGSLKTFKDAEDSQKNVLITELAGDNELQKKALNALSIEELLKLKSESTSEEEDEDGGEEESEEEADDKKNTPAKGVKSKAAKKKDGDKGNDESKEPDKIESFDDYKTIRDKYGLGIITHE